jgi:hypothetical protein
MSTPLTERKQLRKQKSAEISNIFSEYIQKLNASDRPSINIKIDGDENTDVVDDAYTLQEMSRNQV